MRDKIRWKNSRGWGRGDSRALLRKLGFGLVLSLPFYILFLCSRRRFRSSLWRRSIVEAVLYYMAKLMTVGARRGDPRIMYHDFDNLAILTFEFNHIR